MLLLLLLLLCIAPGDLNAAEHMDGAHDIQYYTA